MTRNERARMGRQTLADRLGVNVEEISFVRWRTADHSEMTVQVHDQRYVVAMLPIGVKAFLVREADYCGR